MSHYSGSAGQVDAASEVTGIKSWTLDYTVDVLETTDFDDAGVKSYVVGCSGWSGTFEGLKDGVPLGLAGTAVNIALKETQTSTQKWTGSAFITGVSANTSNDGVVTYSYTYQGTGALTIPTA